MTNPAEPDRPIRPTWRAMPRTVVTLGFVSLLMDTSSELIHSLLPVFLVSALGASTITVGLIEGISEAAAAITKVFSGALSDRSGKRKLLTAVGYGLAAAAKPVFPLAETVGAVLFARSIDRIGKGIRGAPRDALIADVTPPAIRGAAYGLRQALDSIGALLGPLLAVALMFAYADDFRVVFWWAVVPAVLSFLLIVFAVREPAGGQPARRSRSPISRSELARLPPAYWLVVAIGVVFTFARFSEAFLVLKAMDAGLALALLPLVMVWMNIVYSALAAPAGALSDVFGRRGLLVAGLSTLVIGDLALALVPGLTGVVVGVGLWGVHLALSQGLLAALVSDTAPVDRRGTAFGVFNLVTGIVLLAASVLAGALWQTIGPAATFLAGAGFSGLAAIMLAATPGRLTARAADD